MKINTSSDYFLIKKSDFKDLFKIMKICLFLLFAFAFQLMATNTNAQDAIIELKTNTLTVSQLISEIEKQTDYLVVYSNREVNTSRTVNLKNKSDNVSEYLNQTFSGTDIGYDFENNYIVLSKKAQQTATTITNLVQTLQQQGKTVRGTVTDSNGEPVIGATIVVKDNPSQGTVTDIDGNFILSNLPENAVLQITYVGMKPQEASTAGRNTISVVLDTDVELLDEVVVVGYGTQSKRDLTGAIATVKGDELVNRGVSNVSQALQGASPGVMVTRSGGRIDRSASIRIRGITTIGDSNPLVIIDGVSGMSIDDINPNDIESISVLKDAASASIYGSRAAAGVILIATKKGRQDVSEFSYNFEYGILKPSQLPEFTSAVRYMEMANELAWNDNNNNTNEFPIYSQNLIENYTKLNQENPNLYPNTDWQKLIFANSAQRLKHNFNFNIGKKGVFTVGSFNYEKNGLLYNFDNGYNERYTARINNLIDFSNSLKTNINVYYTRNNSNDASYDPIYEARMMPSIYPGEWSDGRVAGGKASENPYGLMKYGGFNNSINSRLGAKASIDFKPIEELTLTAVISPTLTHLKQKSFLPTVSAYTMDDPSRFDVFLYGRTQTQLYENRNDALQVTKQFLINYVNSIDEKHNFNLLAGYEDYSFKNENLSASRTRFDLNNYPYLSIGDENYQFNNGNAYENSYISYFGRLDYNYLFKYYFQANLRTDGSSRFHKNNRWATFPSIALAWVISQESFFKSNSIISFIKLRGSLGLLGNERIGYYPYQSKISFGDAVMYYGGNAMGVKTAAQVNYAIKNISWENTESWNAGIDINLFNNKLQFIGNIYKKTTHDMLLALEIPKYMGFDNPQQNTGKMYTEGYELQLTWNDKIEEFKYSASINISDFKSIMGDLGGTEFIGSKIRKKGSEFDEWYGYLSDGLFLTQEELDKYPKVNSAIRVGDIKFLDVSGPKGVPDGNISSDYDRVLLGGSLPRYIFGSSLNMEYKNFDMSVYLQGVGKQNVLNTSMGQPLGGGWQNIPLFVDGDYWSKYNSEEQNNLVHHPKLSSRTSSSNYTTSNHFMFNGRYLRLQNLTFGYNLPKSFLEKINMQKCRFYVSGFDLFSIDKYPKGWDPESSAVGYYPITSSFHFGISLIY
jgi:TonB-linked SusC/RagA family outer membrane protein